MVRNKLLLHNTMDIYQSAKFICHRMLDHICIWFFCIFGKEFESRLFKLVIIKLKFWKKKKIKSFINKRVTFELSYRCVENFICKNVDNSNETSLANEGLYSAVWKYQLFITFITGLLAFLRNTCLFTFPLFQCLLTIFGTLFILARFWAFIFDLKSCSFHVPIKPNISNRCNINVTYIEGFFSVKMKILAPPISLWS